MEALQHAKVVVGISILIICEVASRAASIVGSRAVKSIGAFRNACVVGQKGKSAIGTEGNAVSVD